MTEEEHALAADAVRRLQSYAYTTNGHRLPAGQYASRAWREADTVQCLACGDYLKNRHGATDPVRVCPEAPLDAIVPP